MNHFSRFLSKVNPKLLLFILSLLAAIPSIQFLTKPAEYFNMHDDMQVIRQLEMDKCFEDGQLPCRWTPDLGYGYGYPLFNYYPPLPYYFGHLFRVLGFSILSTVKMVAISQIILSCAFMYLLGSQIFGPAGGFISAVFYTYAPYHAENIFVRGAMNEAWASVFFPLAFLFSYRQIKKIGRSKINFAINSIAFFGILTSHNPMALIFLPFFALWCIFWLIQTTKPHFSLPLLFHRLIPLFFSTAFSLFLSAFFTVPLLAETKLVQINSMFEGYYHYSVHFPSLFQIFISTFWGDGPSVWGPYDGMAFSIGHLHWILPAFLAFVSVFLIIFKKHRRFQPYLLIFTVALSLFSLFLTHNRSTFIWERLSVLQKIQFPWRILNLSTFLLSFSLASLPQLLALLSKRLTKFIPFTVSLLSIAVIVLNLRFFTPIHHGPITDEQKLTGDSWNRLVTSGIYDYLPKTASRAAVAPAGFIVDSLNPASEYSILSSKKGTDWQLFNLFLNQNALVTLSTLYFPGITVIDNGQPITPSYEPEFGRVTLSLNSGLHQIFLKYQNTPIRTISNYLSLFAWLYLLYSFSSVIWMKARSKK
jgi:hypothetical protein